MIRDLYLVIQNKGHLDRIHHVEVPETTIGCVQTNALCLPGPVVSRKDAVLIQTPTEFMIRDLRSRNGTRLNGQPTEEAAHNLRISIHTVHSHAKTTYISNEAGNLRSSVSAGPGNRAEREARFRTHTFSGSS